MAPTTTEAPARPTLTQLAALGAEELTANLQRALPGNTEQQPAVAAFNSYI